jgi:hypothetical protein
MNEKGKRERVLFLFSRTDASDARKDFVFQHKKGFTFLVK